jgi:hypothetical protein
MNTSAKAFRFDDATLWVDLQDGRTVGVPIVWFPRLSAATPEQRAAGVISASGQGLHWEALDEDISVRGLLEGRGDMTVRHSAAAE